jgi:hypothetical protein
MRDAIADFAKALERAVDDDTGVQVELQRAGALAYLGDTARASAIVDRTRARLAGKLTMPQRIELSNSLGHAYANAPVETGVPGVLELADQLADTTDSFGTNSHYTLSVLDLVDTLVVGIVAD